MKEFNSIRIDLEKGIFEIDGEDFSKEPLVDFVLKYSDRHWRVEYKTLLIGSPRNKKLHEGETE